MEKSTIKKGLVIGTVWLLIGLSTYSVGGTQQWKKESNISPGEFPPFQTPCSDKNIIGYLKQMDSEEQLQLQQLFDAQVGLYGIVSSSGSGHAIPILIKIPHLKLKGFFFAGIIINTGLSALTNVWKLTNLTSGEIIDFGVGPHVVIFIGIGYATYKRILLGGAGSMFGASIIQPTIIP